MERRTRTSDRLRLARARARRAAHKAAVEDAEHFTQRPISVPWSPRELSDAELLDYAVTELESRERRRVIRGGS